MNRIYIFTGKGGVGKTSVAASHAIKSAGEGVNTLLVSTDMAHNLEDLFCFGQEGGAGKRGASGEKPVSVLEHLDIYEMNPGYVMEHDFKEMMNCLGNMLPKTEGASMEDFGMFPGMEELFSLLKIAEFQKSGSYERIIVDCAPTGETLSLLKFPELLAWYMEKLFPVGKVAMRVLSPVSKKLFQVQLPNKAAMSDIEKMYVKLFELQELLKNREITSVRLVTIPEKMVVAETKRNYMYMNLYDFNIDGLYINRILPENIENEFFSQWLLLQKKYMEELRSCFASLPIYEIPWYDEEIRGIRAAKRIVGDVLNEKAVFDIKEIAEREKFEKNDTGYSLKVAVPYADKKDINMFQASSDLVLKIGNFKRNIPLPDVLRSYAVTSAKLLEGVLTIQFEQEEAADE